MQHTTIAFLLLLSLQAAGITIESKVVHTDQLKTADVAKDVHGNNLGLCSTNGTALTGFTRDGHCQDQGDDDAGSHHICIKMESNFCTVTGQPNWCDDNMQCMGQGGTCPIGNWCVCQWAFAGYIQKAGGCDSIVDIQCGATNAAALRAYKAQAANSHVIKTALNCLETRCNLTVTP